MQDFQRRIARSAFKSCLALIAAAMLLPTPGHAESGKPAGESYETCSMITSEYLTIVQLHQKGFSADQLKASLPGITAQGKKDVDALYRALKRDGVVPTYANIDGRYTQCAKRVFDKHGKPPKGSREEHYYFCAGENKIRYQVVLASYLGGTEKEILPQLPEGRRDLATSLIAMAKKDGYEQAFDLLATQLKQCIVGK